jgi:hypothetical protein
MEAPTTGASIRGRTGREQEKKSIEQERAMKKTGFLTLALVIVALSILAQACGPKQVQPKTAAQAQAIDRGIKMDKEECELMALAAGANLRDSGSAISDRESFASNLALLDARSKLAQQLEVLVNGLIRNFNQQHEFGQESASVAKASQIQQGYFEQFLSNTREICKNTYARQDGRYNVYVCVEMNPEQQSAMYKKLSGDKMLHIDFQENQFMKELEKAKEEYRQKQLNN